jgi:glutamate/tyrosine decarboxylase-like PLP-dependent enzyme
MADDDTEQLLHDVAERASLYLASLDQRPVAPTPAAVEALGELAGPVPQIGMGSADVIAQLDRIGGPATMASAGPRYFGFVTGGSLPAALAANWLAGAWDQNSFSSVSSPLGAALTRIAVDWLVDLLGLPAGTGGALVTGATMANFTALAAARRAVLKTAGWDVDADGLAGAPRLTVVVGAEAHAALYKALGMLGLGRNNVVTVPADDEGRMRADRLPEFDGPTILCLQAGNVNSGAFDPAAELIPAARRQGVWVHVDGAFGLWAAVAPARRSLTAGFEQADSWALDAHKWLNVPYDSGAALVREPQGLADALSINAAYIMPGVDADPIDFSPESSQRMRGAEIWAAIKSLGRAGIADLVERNCRQASRLAAGLEAAGIEVLNEVVLNQVLVSFGPGDATERAIAALQESGVCWCGGTSWRGRPAMRISVSSWATQDKDIDASLAEMVRLQAMV